MLKTTALLARDTFPATPLRSVKLASAAASLKQGRNAQLADCYLAFNPFLASWRRDKATVSLIRAMMLLMAVAF